MKRIVALVLILIFILSLSACNRAENNETIAETIDDRIAIPDIADTDEATAKNILSLNGLIPKIEYEYDDNIESGNVIKTSPSTGSKVDKNTKVTVYISKGSSIIDAKNSGITWYNISSEDDTWALWKPYIKDDTLYLDCDVSFVLPIEWSDANNSGNIGIAAITDTFDKAVPIVAEYDKKTVSANETQHITFKVPISDLDIPKPTNIYLCLFAYIDGNKQQQDIRADFFITW